MLNNSLTDAVTLSCSLLTSLLISLQFPFSQNIFFRMPLMTITLLTPATHGNSCGRLPDLMLRFWHSLPAGALTALPSRIPLKPALTILLILGLTGIAPPALAWSNHALGTWQALGSSMTGRNSAPVQVETLESFLASEDKALPSLLQQEELWAIENVAEYPARPAALAYRSGGGRAGFVAALRINPHARLPLYLQVPPGAEVRDKALLSWQEITTLQHANSVINAQFLRLQPGQRVSALDVVASGSDEPDYGLDLGLWSNNGTAHGLAYGFGKEPFGNPALEYATQAPFHMGFFHEQPVIYQAAKFLRRTYPEYRIHLYQTLANHAFRSGHPYWGWRFAGWALHYIQDLTQPYHASLLPGVSVTRMLWINTLDLMGAHRYKQEIITRVSNRHAALENYQYHRMRAAYLRKDYADALLRSTRNIAGDTSPQYTPAAVRQEISRQSHASAAATDATLEQILPYKYISDPNYIFGETEAEIDLFSLLNQAPTAQQLSMTKMVSGLMQQFGVHSRSFILSLVPPKTDIPASGK
jgi:hypothetical protein